MSTVWILLLVNRRGEETGHFPSMFLRKAGQKAEAEPIAPQRNVPPPRRYSAMLHTTQITRLGYRRRYFEWYRMHDVGTTE